MCLAHLSAKETECCNTYLCQTLASVLLADIALGDVLLEDWEEGAEERDVVAEEASLSNAARVEGGKGDASGLVQAPVKHNMRRKDGQVQDLNTRSCTTS
jgi:hypothetical protein